MLLKEREKELEGVVTERERLRKALADCQQQLLREHRESGEGGRRGVGRDDGGSPAMQTAD